MGLHYFLLSLDSLRAKKLECRAGTSSASYLKFARVQTSAGGLYGRRQECSVASHTYCLLRSSVARRASKGRSAQTSSSPNLSQTSLSLQQVYPRSSPCCCSLLIVFYSLSLAKPLRRFLREEPSILTIEACLATAVS